MDRNQSDNTVTKIINSREKNKVVQDRICYIILPTQLCIILHHLININSEYQTNQKLQANCILWIKGDKGQRKVDSATRDLKPQSP